MKKMLLTLAALAMTLSGMANPIGKQAALTVAKNFMQEVNPAAVLQTTTVRHAPGQNSSGDAQPYYVFNAENNQGFVIVSGDDRSEEILGYSDEGTFDVENMPEALEAMLTDFVNELKELDALGLTEPVSGANKAPRKAVAIGRKSVAPLTTSLWTQGVPFANHTPTYTNEYGGTSHAPVGCVATAVAQLLYFHKYAKIPETGIPAYTISSGEFAGEYPALPYREFDFSQMRDSYSGVSSTSTAGKLIGDFLEYVDRALKASFGQTGTYIRPESVPALFRQYFNYKSVGLQRTRSGATEFENLIYNDLSQGLPVWTAGHSMPGRHSFLIDGYSFDDFFHINWGWEGLCNGYFRLAPLNAFNTSTGHAYAKQYYAMIGAIPNDGRKADYKNYTPEVAASAELNDLYFKATDGTAETTDQTSASEFALPITTALVNWSGTLGSADNRSFEVQLALYDANMNLKKTFKPATSIVAIKNPAAADDATPVKVDYTIGNKLHKMNLADGEYKLVPRSRIYGQKNFFFDRARGTYAYVKVVKSGSNITLSLVKTYTVDSYEIIGQLKSGNRAALRVHFTNNSFSKIANTLVLYKKSIADANTQDVQQLRLEPQTRGYVDLGFDVGTSTSQQTLLLNDKEGAPYSSNINSGLTILSAPFKLNTGVVQNPDLEYTWYAENTTKEQSGNWWDTEYIDYIYGNELHGYVEIKNNGTEDYKDFFTLQTKTGTTSYNNVTKYVSSVTALTIPAGGSARISLDELNYADIFDALKKGLASSIVFSLYNGYYNENDLQPVSQQSWTYKSSAYMWWDKNGKMTATTSMSSVPEDAVAVSFLNKSAGSSLRPNSNPNTIYYFTSAPSSNSSFSSKNVVVGTSATATKSAPKAITFDDTYGAYVPYGFTASKGVTYTRTFDYGYEKNGGKGWTTICLPFKVETIKNGSTVIDWFHSAKDSGKQFWVNQFYGEDYLTTLYNYTESMEANTPYIIAVAGSSWGEKWNLVDKAITFSAGNGAKVRGGYNIVDGLAAVDADNQNFVSAAMAYRDIQKGKSVYSMENPGNDFVYVANPDLKSFRGYITKETSNSLVAPQTMSVISLGENELEGGETDGIQSVENEKMTISNNVVYDMQGRVVSAAGLKALPKGMYIMNGKKFVIK